METKNLIERLLWGGSRHFTFYDQYVQHSFRFLSENSPIEKEIMLIKLLEFLGKMVQILFRTKPVVSFKTRPWRSNW